MLKTKRKFKYWKGHRNWLDKKRCLIMWRLEKKGIRKVILKAVGWIIKKAR